MPAMFEDSLFLSQPTSTTAARRKTFAASIGIQLTLVAATVAIPVFHPEALPLISAAPKPVLLITQPRPPQPRPHPIRVARDTSTAVSAPSAEPSTPARGSLRPISSANVGDAPILLAPGTSMGSNTGLPSNLGTAVGSPGPAVQIAPAASRPSRPMAVSSGVTRGLLLTDIKPVYPSIARATRTSGSVVLSAIIDKSGHITALQVVSGPELLRQAALDAVSRFRYRPFLLNGEPTEVETTISVDFRLNS